METTTPKTKRKKTGGRKPHIPTAATRETVAVMSGFGITRPYIARVIGCTESKMARLYKKELESGVDAITRECASVLLHRARNGSEVAAMFLLKTRAHWRDHDPIASEFSGPVTIRVVYEKSSTETPENSKT